MEVVRLISGLTLTSQPCSQIPTTVYPARTQKLLDPIIIPRELIGVSEIENSHHL